LPAAALVAVLLGRAIGARRLLTKGELAVTTVLLTACVGARPPYLPLAAVLLLPGLEQCGRRWRLFVGPALAMLAITICTGLWQFSDRGFPLRSVRMRSHRYRGLFWSVIHWRELRSWFGVSCSWFQRWR